MLYGAVDHTPDAMSDTPTKSKGGFGRFIKRFSSAYPRTPPFHSHLASQESRVSEAKPSCSVGIHSRACAGSRRIWTSLHSRRFRERVPGPASFRSSRCPRSSRASSSRAITADDPSPRRGPLLLAVLLSLQPLTHPTTTIHPHPLPPPPFSNPSRCKVQRLGRLPSPLPVRWLLRQQPPHPHGTHLHAPPRKGTESPGQPGASGGESRVAVRVPHAVWPQAKARGKRARRTEGGGSPQPQVVWW